MLYLTDSSPAPNVSPEPVFRDRDLGFTGQDLASLDLTNRGQQALLQAVDRVLEVLPREEVPAPRRLPLPTFYHFTKVQRVHPRKIEEIEVELEVAYEVFDGEATILEVKEGSRDFLLTQVELETIGEEIDQTLNER
jgi:hypothetical protein